MEDSTFVKGRAGELRACAHLVENGYKIIQTNYRFRGIEVDIIARVGDILCFLEVKSWQTVPEEDLSRSVGKYKRSRIIRAARAFLASTPAWDDHRVRFDVIFMSGVDGVLTHYESAFDASE